VQNAHADLCLAFAGPQAQGSGLACQPGNKDISFLNPRLREPLQLLYKGAALETAPRGSFYYLELWVFAA
jgi:hypothetical protein